MSNTQVIDIESWVNTFGDELFRQAFYKIGNIHIAEDLVQDTFLNALQSKKTFEEIKNERAWLFAILRNKIADYYRAIERKNKHEAASYSEEDLDSVQYFTKMGMWRPNEKPCLWNSLDNLSSDKEFCEILDACIAKLPPNYQMVVQHKIINNERTEDICQDLEISNSNLWQIIYRTKLRLRKCINKHWFQS